MKKIYMLFLSIMLIAVISISTQASETQPFFLLGQNEQAEVVLSLKEVIPLEIGKNPLPLVTVKDGRKVIICAGESKKSGKIEQGASLRLLSPDYKSVEKIVPCDSSLNAYAINPEQTTIWLATRGGTKDKQTIVPKLYRVDLNPFKASAIPLDSIPVDLKISDDGKWLAVAELGSLKSDSSVLRLYNANSMELIARCQIPKNPGLMQFSDDQRYLVVSSYGYPNLTSFDIPMNCYVEYDNVTVPAGVSIIDLEALQSRKHGFEIINHEFIPGENGTVYVMVKGDTSNTVTAIGPSGLLWELSFNYTPQNIQERPGADQVWISGGKDISVIQKSTGNLIKEITANNDIKPILFLDNSIFAYTYNMNSLKLNIINLDQLTIENNVAVGSAGFAAFKTIVLVASVIDYHNSLQPQYVNGVQVPRTTRQVPRFYAWKGNLVACPEKHKLYMLNSYLAQIHAYDMKTGEVDKKLGKLGEETIYLQMAPNQKYLILITGNKWRLINTETDKTDLKFNPYGFKVTAVTSKAETPTPYFSPDETKLYIANKSKITIIDLEKGEKLKAPDTETKDAIVCW